MIRDSASSPTARPSSSFSFKFSDPRRRLRTSAIVIGCAAVLACGSMLILQGTLFSARESEIVRGDRLHTIQLDVLNAAGETKLAQKLTDYLRGRGFDVVETGNYGVGLDRTVILDRSGNIQAAKQVAASLGLEEERVVQRIDRNLYLDVSVVIGRDYKRLLPFK